MKVKIVIREPDFTLQVLNHIDRRYKKWADFAAYHVKRANAKIDIYQLIEDVTDKLLAIKHKKLARLFYTPGFGGYTQLDFWVLRQIRKRIHDGN